MNICFPVEFYRGMESPVFGHFGSAPAFAVVDTVTGSVREIVNGDRSHGHGACSPLKALSGQDVEVVVAGGIGAEALSGLTRAGLEVYRALPGTVGSNLAALERGELAPIQPGQVCPGHGHSCGA